MTAIRLGGFSDIARDLGLMHTEKYRDEDVTRPYRQLIYNWHTRRNKNGFPEAHSEDADGQPLFDLDAVSAWYDQYVPSIGGRPNTTGRPPRKRKEKEA